MLCDEASTRQCDEEKLELRFLDPHEEDLTGCGGILSRTF